MKTKKQKIEDAQESIKKIKKECQILEEWLKQLNQEYTYVDKR